MSGATCMSTSVIKFDQRTRGRPREGLGVGWGLGPVGSQYPFVQNEIARPSRDTSVEAGEGGIVDQLPGCTRLRPPVLFK